MNELAPWAAATSFTVAAWFLRRLVLSIDSFKRDVYQILREHGEQLSAVAERHRLEDGGSVRLHVHRRATDA